MRPFRIRSLRAEATLSRRFHLAVACGVLLTWILLPIPTLACSNDATLDSGIEGEVRIGPLSPVVSEGQEGDDTKPYSAVIRIRSIPEDEIVAEVISGADGKFRQGLAPGRYLVEPEQGDPLPFASPQEVTVDPGAFTTVRIDYDSGIR
jgi:hypothetical protein